MLNFQEQSWEVPEKHEVKSATRWLLLAWALHYLPFFAMGRVLYFHHYLPAFVCSAMLFGVLCDYLIACIQRYLQRGILFRVALTSIVILVLYFSHCTFSVMSYGMHWPLKYYRYMQWMDSWELTR